MRYILSILITGNPDHGQNHVISRILRSKSCDLDRDQDLGDLASGTLHRRKVPLAGSPQGRSCQEGFSGFFWGLAPPQGPTGRTMDCSKCIVRDVVMLA